MLTNDGLHYIVCKSNGFDVYSTKTGDLRRSSNKIKEGVLLCQSYKDTNLFFLVKSIELNKLYIWVDDNDD